MDQDVAVRLANEGVPLRAIARAVQIPSSDLRERLQMARAEGYIIDLPRDDWPVRRARPHPEAFPKDLHCLPTRSAIQAAFGLTATQAELLRLLLQHGEVSREACRDITTYAGLNVQLWRLRARLRSHGLAIETVRGTGFRMPLAHRRQTIVLCGPTRAQYLAGFAESAQRTKPWAQIGVSRRTWYRRLRKKR